MPVVALGSHDAGKLTLADIVCPVKVALLLPIEYVTLCVKDVDALDMLMLFGSPVLNVESQVKLDALGIVVKVTDVLGTDPPVIYVDDDVPLFQVPLILILFVPSVL